MPTSSLFVDSILFISTLKRTEFGIFLNSKKSVRANGRFCVEDCLAFSFRFFDRVKLYNNGEHTIYVSRKMSNFSQLECSETINHPSKFTVFVGL